MSNRVLYVGALANILLASVDAAIAQQAPLSALSAYKQEAVANIEQFQGAKRNMK